MSYQLTIEFPSSTIMVPLPKKVHGVRKYQEVDLTKVPNVTHVWAIGMGWKQGLADSLAQSKDDPKAKTIADVDAKYGRLMNGELTGGRESDPVGVRARVILSSMVKDKLGSRTDSNKTAWDELFTKNRNDAAKWAKLTKMAEEQLASEAGVDFEL